jgi:uncharacterized membrane-anchored protein
MNRVAKVTMLFRVIRILATAAGETGDDALSMTLAPMIIATGFANR